MISERYGYPIEPAEIPDPECARLLAAFNALSDRRPEGYSSVRPLTFAEIDAYARLHGATMCPRFLGALLELDQTYLDAVREARADHDRGEKR